MQLFGIGSGWRSAHDDVLFTAAMCHASVIHADLAKPLDAHLLGWDEINAEDIVAERAVVMANARVAWLNVKLDQVTVYFGMQLLLDCGNNRGHTTFARFFPSPPNELIRLGLESQLAAMNKFPVIADELALPKASALAVKNVIAVFEPGRQAVDARGAATAETTRMSIKQTAWYEKANKLRRDVETALDAYANANNLARGYSASFFMAAKKAAAKVAPTDSELVLALPDAALRALAESYVATLPAATQATIHTRLGH